MIQYNIVSTSTVCFCRGSGSGSPPTHFHCFTPSSVKHTKKGTNGKQSQQNSGSNSAASFHKKPTMIQVVAVTEARYRALFCFSAHEPASGDEMPTSRLNNPRRRVHHDTRGEPRVGVSSTVISSAASFTSLYNSSIYSPRKIK